MVGVRRLWSLRPHVRRALTVNLGFPDLRDQEGRSWTVLERVSNALKAFAECASRGSVQEKLEGREPGDEIAFLKVPGRENVPLPSTPNCLTRHSSWAT